MPFSKIVRNALQFIITLQAIEISRNYLKMNRMLQGIYTSDSSTAAFYARMSPISRLTDLNLETGDSKENPSRVQGDNKRQNQLYKIRTAELVALL